ncbi:unnamed protein product, partial [marine sediment metagenome]
MSDYDSKNECRLFIGEDNFENLEAEIKARKRKNCFRAFEEEMKKNIEIELKVQKDRELKLLPPDVDVDELC